MIESLVGINIHTDGGLWPEKKRKKKTWKEKLQEEATVETAPAEETPAEETPATVKEVIENT